MDLNNIQSYLLKEIADIDAGSLTGAYNIRSDSMSIGRQSTENIEIVSKTASAAWISSSSPTPSARACISPS